MSKNLGLWIIGLIIIGGLAWLIFGGGKNPFSRQDAPSTEPVIEPTPQAEPVAQPDQISTRIQKNSKGTLSLVTINSTTQAATSRELSFDEAVKLVGNVTDVCTGKFNVGSAYIQCTAVRRA